MPSRPLFFFFPLPFFSPPIFFPFGSLVHASEIIYRRTSGTNSLYLDRLGSGSRGFFFFFFFFFPSIYITYYVGTSFERVFRRIDASVSHFKFSRLRSFAFVFQIRWFSFQKSIICFFSSLLKSRPKKRKEKRNKTEIIYFFRGQSGLVLEKAAKEKQKTTRFVTINIHPRD